MVLPSAWALCYAVRERVMARSLGVTEILAMYGAILSSVVLAWNLYRDLCDRARLKITAHVRRIVRSTDGRWYAVAPDLQVGASAQLYVVVKVTNVGRRPIQWSSWGGTYRRPVNGKPCFTVVPVALPKMLGEGDSHSEFTENLNPAGENVKRLFLRDASGKNWYLSWRALKKLKQESRRFQRQA